MTRSSKPSLSLWDQQFLRFAISLGKRNEGRTWPNPSVGAVIVSFHNSVPEIMGTGITAWGGRPHAERSVLEKLGEKAKNCTLYVSLEPCSHIGKAPPCVDIIIESGIKRVVSALKDPDIRVSGQGYSILREHGIEVVETVIQEETNAIHEGHVSRIVKGRPFVTAKLARSADGFVGKRGGQIRISSPLMMHHVHMMRAKADAILAGIGTVLNDDPELTVRLPGMENRSPVRIVMDSFLHLPLSSKLVLSAGKVPLWVLCRMDAPAQKVSALQEKGIKVIKAECVENRSHLDPDHCLKILAEQGITSLFCEGGPHIISSFMERDLVDRFILTTGSSQIGAGGIPAFSQETEQQLTDRFNLIRSLMIDTDLMQVYERLL